MTSELDPKARELIGLALQGERRLPRHRERVRRGVLAAVMAPAALAATDAALAAGKAASVAGGLAPGKVGLLGVATWLKAAPLVLASVVGVVGVQQLRAPEPTLQRGAPTAAAPATAPTARALPVSSSVPAAVRVAEPPATAPKVPRTPEVGTTTPATAPASPSLATELEGLQRAQRSLNAGNAAAALIEVRAVGGQALLAERTALEVFAHCALGQVAAARQKAALFRQLAPRSPLLPRVEASCAGP
jgi:hypothetical protein